MYQRRKIRIGMVLDKSLPDVRVENEAAILSRNGYSVVIFALNHQSRRSYLEEGALYTIFHKAMPQWFVKKIRPFSGTILDIYSPIWWLMIRKFIKDQKIDILHLNDLYMGLPLVNRKFPFIVDLHENYPETIVTYNWSKKFPLNILLSKDLWKHKEGIVLRQADGIITLSRLFASQLGKEYSLAEDKFTEYPNVPDLKELSELSKDSEIYIGKNHFTLFYFGVIAERRGIFECFDAIERLKEEIKDLHFLVVGPVDNADQKRFNEKLRELKDNVTYIPWVEFKDFASLIKIVDLCLSTIKKNPQHESGVANKVFQYMYFEKPLLVSNCIPQQEIVESSDCGYVYESNNIDDLSAKVRKAYQEKEQFGRLGGNARNAVEKLYNTDVMGQSLSDFLEYIYRKKVQ